MEDGAALRRNTIVPAETTEQQRWWAAGYFDSRGRIYVYPNQVIIGVVDKEQQLVEHFTRCTGIDPRWIRRRPRACELMASSMEMAAILVRALGGYVAGDKTRAKLLEAGRFLSARDFDVTPLD